MRDISLLHNFLCLVDLFWDLRIELESGMSAGHAPVLLMIFYYFHRLKFAIHFILHSHGLSTLIPMPVSYLNEFLYFLKFFIFSPIRFRPFCVTLDDRKHGSFEVNKNSNTHWISVFKWEFFRYLVLRNSANSSRRWPRLNTYKAASISIGAAALIAAIGSLPNMLRYQVAFSNQIFTKFQNRFITMAFCQFLEFVLPMVPNS